MNLCLLNISFHMQASASKFSEEESAYMNQVKKKNKKLVS